MKKLLILRSILYMIVGLFVLIFKDNVIDYLSYLIGFFMIIVSVEELIYHVVIKDFKTKKHTIATPLAIFILSMIILTINKNDVSFVCIIWAVIGIVRSTKELNECLYDALHKEHFLLQAIESIVSIVLSIMLISNPELHVNFHLILLGLELMVEGVRIFLKFIYFKKYPQKVKEEILKHKEFLDQIEKTSPMLLEDIKNKYDL